MGNAWSAPGGAGNGDSTALGNLALAAQAPGQLSGDGLRAALQAMVDGQAQEFLVRRTDASYQTTSFAARLVVEFDLNTPPN